MNQILAIDIPHAKNRVPSFWQKLSLLILASSISLLIFSSAANGDDYDFTPAKKAISDLKNLPGAVNSVISVINKTNFGPFPMSGSCGYDHAWYCLGMACKTFKWSWSPDFKWLQSNLKNTYGNISNISSQFDTQFSPIKHWLLITLPAFTDEFNTEKTKIFSAEAIINAPNSTPEQIAAAKADILSSINKIIESLNQGAGELQTGTSTLSQFDQHLNSALNRVTSTKNSMDAMLNSSSDRLKKDIASWPCGTGDITNKFNGAKSIVRTQFQAVQDTAQKYGVVSSKTDMSTSVLLGVVVAIRFNYQSVLQDLQAAKISPAGAIQKLRLNVALAAWRDLAEYAKQQL